MITRRTSALLSVILVLACAGTLTAQAGPKRVLANTDVVKFAKDFQAISTEFDNLGVDVGEWPETPAGLSSAIHGMRANAEADRIVRKYGWNESFFEKFAAILQGWIALEIERTSPDTEAEIKAAIDQIEADTGMSAADKKMIKDQVLEFGRQYKAMHKQFKDAVHPEDLRLINNHKPALDKVFDSEE